MSFTFSDNIQRGILYLALTDRDFFLQVNNLVKPIYFDQEPHQKIYEATLAYFDKYKKIPHGEHLVECVKSSLRDNEDIELYADEINDLNNIDKSSIENKEFILDSVEDFSKKQAMKEAILTSVELLEQGKLGDVEGVVREALLISRQVNLGQDYYSAAQSRWIRNNKVDNRDKFKTVFSPLDDELDGGLSAKELAMVIAPAGVGKSLYLANQAVKALEENRQVLYISLEMSEDKVAERIDSIVTKLNQANLKETSTQLKLFKRLDIIKTTFPKSRLVIKEFPTGNANVNDIRALLNDLASREDFVPEVIIVDYLELLRPNRTIEAEYQAQQRICEELRGLGVELNCLIWTATQTNRNGRRVDVITDAELADSYGKIRTADFAISLNQNEEEYDQNRMRVYVVKSRNGKSRYQTPARIDYTTLRMSKATVSEVSVSGLPEQ